MHGTRNRRPGQSLVEFALIALVLYLLLAVTIEMGRAMYAAQVVQTAADLAGRELSKVRLPAGATFGDCLKDDYVKKFIYDECHLVIDLDKDVLPNMTIPEYCATLPLINQQLCPVYIFETVTEPNNTTRRLLRYPGALIQRDGCPNGTVAVPIVVERELDPKTKAFGTETIRWFEVLEEIVPSVGVGAFAFNPTEKSGRVNVRINYPFQAATLSAYETQTPGVWPPEPKTNAFNANDPGVTEKEPLKNGTPVDAVHAPSIYAGKYGLGYQLAWGRQVRPYRRVLTGVSVGYQRELTY